MPGSPDFAPQDADWYAPIQPADEKAAEEVSREQRPLGITGVEHRPPSVGYPNGAVVIRVTEEFLFGTSREYFQGDASTSERQAEDLADGDIEAGWQ